MTNFRVIRFRGDSARLLLPGAAGRCPAMAAGVANPGNMTRYELPGYTMVAVDNGQCGRDMAKLPRLKRALELSLGIDVKPTGVPTYFYVVSNSIWDRYLENSAGIPSEFVPTRFANYVIANNTRIDRQNLFHEHTHLYLYNRCRCLSTVVRRGYGRDDGRALYTGPPSRSIPRGTTTKAAGSPRARIACHQDSPEYSARNSSTACTSSPMRWCIAR